MHREINFSAFKNRCIAALFVLPLFDVGKANEILFPLERQLWPRDGHKVVKRGSTLSVTYKVILGWLSSRYFSFLNV